MAFILYRGLVKSISTTCTKGTVWNEGGSQAQVREVEDVRFLTCVFASEYCSNM